jgi:hypothetical protein
LLMVPLGFEKQVGHRRMRIRDSNPFLPTVKTSGSLKPGARTLHGRPSGVPLAEAKTYVLAERVG